MTGDILHAIVLGLSELGIKSYIMPDGAHIEVNRTIQHEYLGTISLTPVTLSLDGCKVIVWYSDNLQYWDQPDLNDPDFFEKIRVMVT